MEFVDPIKDLESIKKIKELLNKRSKRDFLLFVFGINTGVRINELLNLKVKDIYGDTGVKQFLTMFDKHKEEKNIYLNRNVRNALTDYLKESNLNQEDYLFKTKNSNQPITRQQAYRVINQAAKEVGTKGKIGTHTMRKTFGYHAFKKGIALSIIQSIYGHHSPSETLNYIGIDKYSNHPIKVDVNL